ncbi:F-box/LRR-repeat protein [Hordeum vulgare]|nr:F-box/LRR-repeat protein [Hordeum vulgare]
MLEVHAAAGYLRVSSPTLRSIGFRDGSGEKAELLIDDAPRLERLLLPYSHLNDCATIRVIRAPKLEIFGPFSPDLCELPVFQGMGTVSPANSISTVKFSTQSVWMFKQNVPYDDRPHPMECLETNLKEVVLKYFSGYDQQIDSARFFVLNAKVLNKMEFNVREDQYTNEFVDRQRTLLQAENRASRDAQFEFRKTCGSVDYHVSKRIHDMSVAGPFIDRVDA